jgi:hypothetical protein
MLLDFHHVVNHGKKTVPCLRGSSLRLTLMTWSSKLSANSPQPSKRVVEHGLLLVVHAESFVTFRMVPCLGKCGVFENVATEKHGGIPLGALYILL